MQIDHKEFIIHGMMRSGHHAVTYWIGDQLAEGIKHFNAIKLWKLNKEGQHTQYLPAGYAGDCTVSIEDDFIDETCKWFCALTDKFDYITKPDFILNVRDPFNMFSSRVFHEGIRPRKFAKQSEFNKVSELWLNHATALKNQDKCYDVYISYNQWHLDTDYRIEKARELGFETDGSPYIPVAREGGGSTFQKSAGNDSSKLKVKERWKAAIDDINYLRLFNEEIFELAVEVFPDTVEARDAVYAKWKKDGISEITDWNVAGYTVDKNTSRKNLGSIQNSIVAKLTDIHRRRLVRIKHSHMLYKRLLESNERIEELDMEFNLIMDELKQFTRNAF